LLKVGLLQATFTFVELKRSHQHGAAPTPTTEDYAVNVTCVCSGADGKHKDRFLKLVLYGK